MIEVHVAAALRLLAVYEFSETAFSHSAPTCYPLPRACKDALKIAEHLRQRGGRRHRRSGARREAANALLATRRRALEPLTLRAEGVAVTLCERGTTRSRSSERILRARYIRRRDVHKVVLVEMTRSKMQSLEHYSIK